MFNVDISQGSLSISTQIRLKRTLQIMAIISIILYAAAIFCRISYGYPHHNEVGARLIIFCPHILYSV